MTRQLLGLILELFKFGLLGPVFQSQRKLISRIHVARPTRESPCLYGLCHRISSYQAVIFGRDIAIVLIPHTAHDAAPLDKCVPLLSTRSSSRVIDSVNALDDELQAGLRDVMMQMSLGDRARGRGVASFDRLEGGLRRFCEEGWLVDNAILGVCSENRIESTGLATAPEGL